MGLFRAVLCARMGARKCERAILLPVWFDCLCRCSFLHRLRARGVRAGDRAKPLQRTVNAVVRAERKALP